MFYLLVNNPASWGVVAVMAWKTVLQTIVFVYGIAKYKKGKVDWKLKPFDFACLGISLLSLAVYYWLDSPLIGTIILFAGQNIAVIPTFRRSLKQPELEILWTEILIFARHMVLSLCVAQGDEVGYIQTYGWAISTVVSIACILIGRRRKNERMD
jgi:hypothetical protein